MGRGQDWLIARIDLRTCCYVQPKWVTGTDADTQPKRMVGFNILKDIFSDGPPVHFCGRIPPSAPNNRWVHHQCVKEEEGAREKVQAKQTALQTDAKHYL